MLDNSKTTKPVTLTNADVEFLNAHGPYSMAVWTSGDISVGNEEGLKGRSAYFIKLIRDAILANYSMEEIKGFSILDIGCNDGWVLHQLIDLPFAKMVGIEPREKNIEKGRVVRRLLNIENRVDCRVGDIESLGEEKFDIIICAGVLYHVESIPLALRRVRECCRKFLFIESRCIASEHATDALKAQIEMRDLAYEFRDRICGVTAQKFESSYHDGSARVNTIVNVPTTETLLMTLDLLGFVDLKVVSDAATYRAALGHTRPLDGVCITAKPGQIANSDEANEQEWIARNERGLAETILPATIVKPLYESFDSGKLQQIVDTKLSGLENHFAREIVKNFQYSPRDKIALEMGKILVNEGKLEEAVTVLKSISGRINADWRSVYRSFALLTSTLQRLGRTDEAARYRELLVTCNPKYPNIGIG